MRKARSNGVRVLFIFVSTIQTTLVYNNWLALQNEVWPDFFMLCYSMKSDLIASSEISSPNRTTRVPLMKQNVTGTKQYLNLYNEYVLSDYHKIFKQSNEWCHLFPHFLSAKSLLRVEMRQGIILYCDTWHTSTQSMSIHGFQLIKNPFSVNTNIISFHQLLLYCVYLERHEWYDGVGKTM